MKMVGTEKVEGRVVKVVWHIEHSQFRIEMAIWENRLAGREREW